MATTADNANATLKDSLFIIDWDNTLFTTSYFTHKGLLPSYFDDSKSEKDAEEGSDWEELRELEKVVECKRVGADGVYGEGAKARVGVHYIQRIFRVDSQVSPQVLPQALRSHRQPKNHLS